MKLVIVESPYAADTPEALSANVSYARDACLDCLDKGESPYASHLFWPQMLDDSIGDERRLGIQAGLAWSRAADYHVFYTDKGWSQGMLDALKYCIVNERPHYFRALYGPVQNPPWRP